MFFGVFLGPILALVLLNTIVFVLVIRVLVKHSARKLKDANISKKLQGTFKTLISIMSIMFMFGLQWLFGALTIAQASLAFQWLFVIFSTLQGFFLFLFFVVLGKETRDEWLNVFTCGKRKKGRKRGPSVSQGSKSKQTRKPQTSSTYLAAKPNRNLLLRMSASSITSDAERLVSSSGDSTAELSSLTPSLDCYQPVKKSLQTSNTTHMQRIAEENETEFTIVNRNAEVPDELNQHNDPIETETEFVIVNENADLTDEIHSDSEEIEKVDLSALDAAKRLEEGTNYLTDSQLPPHIVHGRYMHHREPQLSTVESKEKETEKVDLTRSETIRVTNRDIPTVVSSQVPPHIAERRFIHHSRTTISVDSNSKVEQVNLAHQDAVVAERRFVHHSRTTTSTDSNSKVEKVNLTHQDAVAKLNESKPATGGSQVPLNVTDGSQVPLHILQRRFMRSYNTAPGSLTIKQS